jgi:hypothetical protein
MAKEARLHNSPDARTFRRSATRSARIDRKRYWSQIADNMEAAAGVGDFGKLFRIIRNTSRTKKSADILLRDKNGQLIQGKEGKLSRWVEHFDQQLNRTAMYHGNLVAPVRCEPYQVNCEPPDALEIALAANKLKSKKAPGEDGIPPEIFKCCIYALLGSLHTLFRTIWETEIFPKDWATSILIPIPKKGDITKCENYRGISLIDITAKLLTAILLNRFVAVRDARTRTNQGGFRRGRGCVDQIFTLRRILEHRHKFQQPTTTCFIDFRTAFDSVDRDSLWNILKEDGMPEKLVGLIKSYYSNTRARVRAYGEESPEFPLNSGVRQGCPLSPVLFNYAIDWTMNHALADYPGVQLGPDTWIADLEFADDIVILADTPNNLQPVLDRVVRFAKSIGLEINTSKTKFMSTAATLPQHPVTINGEQIELVQAFKYLGSTITPNGQAKNEIQLRVDVARRAFLQLRRVLWTRSEISLRTKVRVYRAAIRPVLCYGCETWPLRVQDLRRLEILDHWCLRYILEVNLLDQISNKEVRQRCCTIEKLSVLLQNRRLQWFGHVLRRPTTELSRKVLLPEPLPQWRCRLGGQLKTWISTIKEDVECLGLKAVYGLRTWNRQWVSLCSNLAADRHAWAAAIRDIHEADLSSCRR